MPQLLNLNGSVYSIDNLKDVATKSHFEEETVGFIIDWQSGREEFLQNTSGSTGTPKIIEITRSQMMASALMTIKALGLKENQTSLLCLSPEYIGGKMMIVRSLINKMNIIAREPVADPLSKISHAIDFAALTPMQLLSSLKSSATIADNIGTIILGGGPISSKLNDKVQYVKAQCYATYGMTETASHIALKKLNGPNKSNYYKCLDQTEINLDDRGCLTINSAATNFQTITTNDLVHLISDNQFDWIGRIDNIINTGGIKVQSEKVEKIIESVLRKLSLTNRCVIVGLPDEKYGEKVTLVVEGTISKKNEQSLFSAFESHLSKFEMPKSIMYLPKFDETATGKIDRKKLIPRIS